MGKEKQKEKKGKDKHIEDSSSEGDDVPIEKQDDKRDIQLEFNELGSTIDGLTSEEATVCYFR